MAPVAPLAPPFPRLALVAPPLLPLALLGITALSGLYGPRGGGIHSSGGALLAVVFWLSCIGALLFEVVMVPKAVKRFLLEPRLQTGANLFCIAVPVIVAVLAVLGLLISS